MSKWLIVLIAVSGVAFIAPQVQAHPKHGKTKYVKVKKGPSYSLIYLHGKPYYYREGHYYKKHKGRYVIIKKPAHRPKVRLLAPRPLFTINVKL